MLTLCAALLLAAPPTGLYRGTIGEGGPGAGGKTFEVVMLLESPSAGRLEGRYFYWRQRQDIPVEGTFAGGELTLVEHGGKNGAASGTFTGTFEKGDWSGRWTSSSKKVRLPVKMIRVAEASAGEMERWRKGLVRPAAHADGVSWEWRAARASPQIALPFLVKMKDGAVERKVNAAMQARLDQMGCSEGTGEWSTRAEVTWAARDVFSVSIHSSHYCGGPYPTNDANGSVVFDLRTGEEVALRALFSAPYEEVLGALLADRIGEEPDDRPGECPKKWPLEELQEFTLRFVVVSGGVLVQPELPHVIEGCAFEEKIPFAKMARMAPRDGLIARLAAE